MTKLHQLNEVGQSVWLDNISRDMLGDGGDLARLVDLGIRGVTSNPTIFQKALGGSSAYDDQLRAVLAALPQASTEEVFDELAVVDIRGAADVLRRVYDESGGADGFVSLEVSPSLAHDTEGTIADARRLWAKVDRPNLMIKVPATAAGVPAVERLIADGINVNVTLMFSLQDYENVAQAYLRGLAACDVPAQVNSVASFFVSRVDTKADAALEKVGTPEALALRGKIAIANAKLAYRRYQQLFESPAFGIQADRGGKVQRVLWASTSTKNPAYPDTIYVDGLIGPQTVNTMPPATVEATLSHGTVAVTLTEDVDAAAGEVAALSVLGIDFDEITAELQTEGVQAFADSMTELYETLSRKIETLR